MSLSPEQFKEHRSLMGELGGLIAQNRQLFPIPPHLKGQVGGGRPGYRDQFKGDPEGLTRRLKEKIESTKVSNSTYTGPLSPDTKWVQH